MGVTLNNANLFMGGSLVIKEARRTCNAEARDRSPQTPPPPIAHWYARPADNREVQVQFLIGGPARVDQLAGVGFLKKSKVHVRIVSRVPPPCSW